MNESKATLLTSKTVVEREGVLTVIQTSFVVEDARAIVSLQTFQPGEGGYCASVMVHPQTARALARVLDIIADEYDKHLERSKPEAHDGK